MAAPRSDDVMSHFAAKGRDCLANDDYAGALQHLRTAETRARAARGVADVETLKILGLLGDAHAGLGRHADAARCYLEALAGYTGIDMAPTQGQAPDQLLQWAAASLRRRRHGVSSPLSSKGSFRGRHWLNGTPHAATPASPHDGAGSAFNGRASAEAAAIVELYRGVAHCSYTAGVALPALAPARYKHLEFAAEFYDLAAVEASSEGAAADARQSQGRVLMRMGRWANAARAFERAVAAAERAGAEAAAAFALSAGGLREQLADARTRATTFATARARAAIAGLLRRVRRRLAGGPAVCAPPPPPAKPVAILRAWERTALAFMQKAEQYPEFSKQRLDLLASATEMFQQVAAHTRDAGQRMAVVCRAGLLLGQRGRYADSIDAFEETLVLRRVCVTPANPTGELVEAYLAAARESERTLQEHIAAGTIGAAWWRGRRRRACGTSAGAVEGSPVEVLRPVEDDTASSVAAAGPVAGRASSTPGAPEERTDDHVGGVAPQAKNAWHGGDTDVAGDVHLACHARCATADGVEGWAASTPGSDGDDGCTRPPGPDAEEDEVQPIGRDATVDTSDASGDAPCDEQRGGDGGEPGAAAVPQHRPSAVDSQTSDHTAGVSKEGESRSRGAERGSTDSKPQPPQDDGHGGTAPAWEECDDQGGAHARDTAATEVDTIVGDREDARSAPDDAGQHQHGVAALPAAAACGGGAQPPRAAVDEIAQRPMEEDASAPASPPPPSGPPEGSDNGRARTAADVTAVRSTWPQDALPSCETPPAATAAAPASASTGGGSAVSAPTRTCPQSRAAASLVSDDDSFPQKAKAHAAANSVTSETTPSWAGATPPVRAQQQVAASRPSAGDSPPTAAVSPRALSSASSTGAVRRARAAVAEARTSRDDLHAQLADMPLGQPAQRATPHEARCASPLNGRARVGAPAAAHESSATDVVGTDPVTVGPTPKGRFGEQGSKAVPPLTAPHTANLSSDGGASSSAVSTGTATPLSSRHRETTGAAAVTTHSGGAVGRTRAEAEDTHGDATQGGCGGEGGGVDARAEGRVTIRDEVPAGSAKDRLPGSPTGAAGLPRRSSSRRGGGADALTASPTHAGRPRRAAGLVCVVAEGDDGDRRGGHASPSGRRRSQGVDVGLRRQSRRRSEGRRVTSPPVDPVASPVAGPAVELPPLGQGGMEITSDVLLGCLTRALEGEQADVGGGAGAGSPEASPRPHRRVLYPLLREDVSPAPAVSSDASTRRLSESPLLQRIGAKRATQPPVSPAHGSRRKQSAASGPLVDRPPTTTGDLPHACGSPQALLRARSGNHSSGGDWDVDRDCVSVGRRARGGATPV